MLLTIWTYCKDFILNEQLIDYKAPASYPKVNSTDIFYPNQTVEFHFSCSADRLHPVAERWVLFITGTAYTNNPGHIKISIDDSDSKKFRTFAFENYRFEYVLPFNKYSHAMPQKVRVRFKFTGNNSDPLFEIPLIRLIAEEGHRVPLPKNTIFPFSHKLYKKSGTCHIIESKIL